MSSEFIEIEEKTIDEAIEKACQEFGVPREKLNIEIISGESGGFLGLFSKKAKIRASLLALNIDFSFSDKPREKAEKPKEKNEPRVKPENSGAKIETKAASRKKPEKEAAAVAGLADGERELLLETAAGTPGLELAFRYDVTPARITQRKRGLGARLKPLLGDEVLAEFPAHFVTLEHTKFLRHGDGEDMIGSGC